MLKTESSAYIWLLGGICAFGALGVDMYLPALPLLAHELGVSVEYVQMTIILYMVGMAGSQLLYGPLSDHYGRRPVLLFGLMLFLMATIGILLSSTFSQLLFFRILQALGAGVGPAIGLAIVRDIYPPEKSGSVMAKVGSFIAITPAVAPILGGLVLAQFNWKGIFAVMGLLAGMIAIVVWTQLQETRPLSSNPAPDDAASGIIGRCLRSYWTLLRDDNYLIVVLLSGMGFSGFLTLIVGSPFILMGYWHVSAQYFGYIFATIPLGFMAGCILGGLLSQTSSGLKVLSVGTVLCAIAGVSAIGLYLLHVGMVGFIISAGVYAIGLGFMVPPSMNLALARYPTMAGAASALLMFSQVLIASIVVTISNIWFDNTPFSVVNCMAVASISALVLSLVLNLEHEE